METETKSCLLCGTEFEMGHGNNGHCCEEHRKKRKKIRQKLKYQGIKSLLPILNSNHQILATLLNLKQESFTVAELESENLDFSLHRRLYPDPENIQLVRLDFGTYYLETIDFQTFKLLQNAPKTRESWRLF